MAFLLLNWISEWFFCPASYSNPLPWLLWLIMALAGTWGGRQHTQPFTQINQERAPALITINLKQSAFISPYKWLQEVDCACYKWFLYLVISPLSRVGYILSFIHHSCAMCSNPEPLNTTMGLVHQVQEGGHSLTTVNTFQLWLWCHVDPDCHSQAWPPWD